MKNKIRALASTISVAALSMPVLVLAQYQPPAGTGLQSTSLYDIINGIMKWILMIIGIIAVIGFCIAGILYLTAAGDEDRIKQAKSALIMSIIGVIVALLGLVILTAVNNMLGGKTF